jgi:hypothetical protein
VRHAGTYMLQGLICIGACGLAYVGIILVIFGYGPRVNIDFVDLPPAAQHAAMIESRLAKCLGMIGYVVALVLIARSHRIAAATRRLFRAEPE